MSDNSERRVAAKCKHKYRDVGFLYAVIKCLKCDDIKYDESDDDDFYLAHGDPTHIEYK